MLKGISSNYLSVLIKGEDSIRNRIVKVHINEVSGSYATGQTEDGKK